MVLFKGGATRYIFNKTSRTVTKISASQAPKTPSPTFGRQRELVQRRAVKAEDINNVSTTMGKPPKKS